MRPSRPQIAGAVVTAALVCALITPAQATAPVEDAGGHPRPSPQIVTPLVAGFPAAPQPALPGGTDWRERALAYDAFVYDWNPSGEGHPTILADTTHLNMDSDTYKIPVYYADTRIESDGYQEAVDGWVGDDFDPTNHTQGVGEDVLKVTPLRLGHADQQGKVDQAIADLKAGKVTWPDGACAKG